MILMYLIIYLDFDFWCSFFFFKQKTAYEMRISDWSSDVCSSDLFGAVGDGVADDLAAFDAALAYAASLGGGRVDVPAGEFRLSGPLVFPDSSGLELVGTSKASAGGLNANGATKLIADHRSEEPTSALQSLMRISYAVFCLKQKKTQT